jgi:hypothetical protein
LGTSSGKPVHHTEEKVSLIMSHTNTDVVVTQYRAEFKSEPFVGYSWWHITSGWEHRQTLPRRRRWTVARDYSMLRNGHPYLEQARKVPNTNIGYIHESMLIDPDAIVVFVPDAPGSRYGTARRSWQRLHLRSSD